MPHTNINSHNIFWLFAAILLCISSAHADVYEFAKNAAYAANENFKRNPPNDGAIMSARASQEGKGVAYDYVIAFRNNVTESELRPWRASTRGEIFPPACSELRKTPVFNQGFYFRYRYLNRNGMLMDDFVVNKPSCEGL